MKTRQNQAATFFGLSIVGFGLCIALAFIASNAESNSPAEKPAYKPAATSSKTEPVVAQLPETPSPDPTPVATKVTLDPASVQKGKQNYDMFCLACHGAEDTAIDSPSNLFDAKWYHGSDREGIELSIKNGIYEKGMPGWGEMIPAEDITALVDYLISFQQ